MPVKQKEITGRKCYDHLGGKLGALLLEQYITLGWIELEEGRSTVYRVTELGRGGFAQIGVFIDRENADI